MSFTQSIPHWLTLTTLGIDIVGLFCIICVLIGVWRSMAQSQGSLIRQSCYIQLVSTTIVSLFVIVGKVELVYRNWSEGYLYVDKSDIAKDGTLVGSISCASMLIFIMLPVYSAALCQILTIDILLRPGETLARRVLVNHPKSFYGSSYIPGFVSLLAYWIEVKFRGFKPYSNNGMFIAPYNQSYVVYGIYLGSCMITLLGLFYSIRSIRAIKEHIGINAAINQIGIPGHLVFQVLYMGLMMPIIGICKLPEILIWVYPSCFNLPYVYLSVASVAANPFLTFYFTGCNKNIAPFVPIFGNFLEQEYEKRNKIPKFIRVEYYSGSEVSVSSTSSKYY